MIILRGGTNKVSLTLNEKFGFHTPSVSTYHDLYFVVKITDRMDEYTQNFILKPQDDLSLNQSRYNQFTIGITGTYNPFLENVPDPWGASQSYPIVGLTGSQETNFDSQYEYEIWAMEGPAPISGTISLYPSGATALGPAFIEKGRMLYTNIYGKPWHTIH